MSALVLPDNFCPVSFDLEIFLYLNLDPAQVKWVQKNETEVRRQQLTDAHEKNQSKKRDGRSKNPQDIQETNDGP